MKKNKDKAKQEQTTKIISFLVCLFFFVFGGTGFISGLKIFILSEQSKSWPTAKGVVVSSEVDRTYLAGAARFPPAYSAKIRFEYAVDGRKYYTSNISSFSVTYNAGYGKALQKYPVGKGVDVYYKPDNPKISILEPGAQLANYIILLISGTAGIIGLWGVIYIPFNRKKQ